MVVLAALAWVAPARAQNGIAQPGESAAERDAQRQQQQQQQQPAAGQPTPAQPAAPEAPKPAEPIKNAWPLQEGHLPSYAAPPRYESVVRGAITDNDPIGDYGQPRWTGARLFPTTRVYILPANTVQMEYWLDVVMPFGGGSSFAGQFPGGTPDDSRLRNLYELEIGLGYHLQLDLYLRTEQQGYQGALQVESEKLELRWALADWGVIPGNPTLYFELSRFSGGPMTLETKVLLGGNLASRLHWGVNLVFERDLGGTPLYNQYGVTAGLSGAVVDRKFSLGVEVQVESTDGGRDDRGNLSELWILGGPSIQWRPVPPLHIDLVALFGGLGDHDVSGAFAWRGGMRPLVVIGWEL
jgi:hypothetical protein